MQVSAQYASSHFEEISSAVDRGESVEILRPGKAALHLVPSSLPQAIAGRRILGAGRGELRVPGEEEWRAMDKQIEREMNDAPHDDHRRSVKLLLDAHVLLWAIYEPEKLSSTASALIEDTANELFVSLATLWELANKAAAFRLSLAGSSVPRLLDRIEQLSVTFLAITQKDILAASTLPRHHADPFDRMIIAQAQAHSLSLITQDREMAQYDISILWR